MNDFYFEKISSILQNISDNIAPIYFWEDYSFWMMLVSATALVVTLIFLIRYTRATEQIARYQMIPAVDVNMVYDRNTKKTYFWFANASSIPAFVLIKYIVNTSRGDSIGPLRIPPYHPQNIHFRKTATTFDFINTHSINNIEVILNITVTPAVNNSHAKNTYKKNYRFNQSKSRWDETTWGYPDPPLPSIRV